MRIGCAILAVVTGLSAQGAVAAPDDRSAWLEQVERARQEYRAFVERALLARPVLRTASHFDPPDSDPTLRDGDILVQAAGLMIFRAGAGSEAGEGRLVPLDPAGHRRAGELEAIARVIQAE